MPALNQIRADYEAQTIVVYQAYSLAIARAALEAGRFVPPFSFNRMTWIKPSFLWLMERSNWGHKSGQEYILKVRISRSGWDEALNRGVLTSYASGAHRNAETWRLDFERAQVHVQWDPERSLRGSDLGYSTIQVGISRHLIERYVNDWVQEISDMTPQVRKIHALLQNGQSSKAAALLPKERIYQVPQVIKQSLNIAR
jgi:hypothetical protein